MLDISSILNNNILTWVTLLTIGFLAVAGVFDKVQRMRRKELDNSEDRLINILQKTVKELEDKINIQSSNINTLASKVSVLEHDNETLIRVLQGRDDQTQKFYTRAFTAMDNIKETNDAIREVKQILSRSVVNA